MEKLKPVQFGFGVKGGLKLWFMQYVVFVLLNMKGQWLWLSLISEMLFRKFMLGEIKDICPELLPLFLTYLLYLTGTTTH